MGNRGRLHAAGTVLSIAMTAVPFVPGAREFLRRGVPDILFTDDGAALELGTLHAARGTQLVGPYSRFGWNHPGPAYFYLALPFYLALGRRGPALHVFALAANFAAAVSLILTLRRLCGTSFAVVASALFAVYALVALPFLVGDYWNPWLPVLPLALLSLIGARLALGPDDRALAIVVFLASPIVQTHVGFAPEVIAMIALPLVVRGCRLVEPARSELHPASRRHRLIALGILISMWALPLYEAATGNPGNLQRLLAFFAPGALGQYSWTEAATTVLDQSAVMPFALARTLRLFQGTAPPRRSGSSQAYSSRQSERSWPSPAGGGTTS